MKKEELTEVLESHKKWGSGDGGDKADLSHASLIYANLSEADLRSANLREANLIGADLCGVNLSYLEIKDDDSKRTI